MKPATPLPWSHDGWERISGGENGYDTIILASEAYGEPYIEMDSLDAAYIVHAANAYPKLVAALTEVLAAHANVRNRQEQLTSRDEACALLTELGEIE